MKRLSIIGAITAVAVMAALTLAVPASAHRPGHGVKVTHGTFETLPGGTELGYTITGHAVMVRLHGRTFVNVHVGGLEPRTTYPTHVHDAPCSEDPPGGVHYQHEIGGAVDPVNEIWPEVRTNRAGRGLGDALHGHRARSDAQSIVIHYPADTSIRLACLDLSGRGHH